MLILTLRTDMPVAEIGLFRDKMQIVYESWDADRQLAEGVHKKILTLLDNQKLGYQDLQAVAVFSGPGSFTGLRIGITVANALADGLHIPVVGTQGIDWVAKALQMLENNMNDHIVLPEYGSPPHITLPKK